jgi:hypothetical protein
MNRADKIAMFSKEIGDITDGNLRQLATEIIACADDYLASRKEILDFKFID